MTSSGVCSLVGFCCYKNNKMNIADSSVLCLLSAQNIRYLSCYFQLMRCALLKQMEIYQLSLFSRHEDINSHFLRLGDKILFRILKDTSI